MQNFIFFIYSASFSTVRTATSKQYTLQQFSAPVLVWKLVVSGLILSPNVVAESKAICSQEEK